MKSILLFSILVQLSFMQTAFGEVKCYGPHDVNKICLDSKKSSLCDTKDINGRAIPKNDCSGPIPCFYVKDVVATATAELTYMPQTINLPSDACSSINSVKSIKLPVNKNNVKEGLVLTQKDNRSSSDKVGGSSESDFSLKENITKLPSVVEYSFNIREFVAKPDCVYDFAGPNERIVLAGNSIITYTSLTATEPKKCDDYKIVSQCIKDKGFDKFPGAHLSCNGIVPPAPPVVTPPKVVVDGSCGTSHGLTLTAQPSENLCLTGTASLVTQNLNDWSWTCNGENGGIIATCLANKKQEVASCGVWACNTPSEAGNTCDKSKTGQVCATLNSVQEGAGGSYKGNTTSQNGKAAAVHDPIDLICVTVDTCKGDKRTCALKESLPLVCPVAKTCNWKRTTKTVKANLCSGPTKDEFSLPTCNESRNGAFYFTCDADQTGYELRTDYTCECK